MAKPSSADCFLRRSPLCVRGSLGRPARLFPARCGRSRFFRNGWRIEGIKSAPNRSGDPGEGPLTARRLEKPWRHLMRRCNLLSRNGVLAGLWAILFLAPPANLFKLHIEDRQYTCIEKSEQGRREEVEAIVLCRSALSLPRKREAPLCVPSTVFLTSRGGNSTSLPLLSVQPATRFSKRNQVGSPLLC